MKRSSGEGTISQLPSGSWCARITIKGARKSHTEPTQRKAREWLTRIRKDLDEETYVDPSDMPLGKWWTKWIATYKSSSVTSATLSTYAASRARLPVSLFEQSLCKLTPSDIQAALNGLSDTGRGRRTTEITRTALKMCLDRAVKDKMLRSNPVDNTVLPARESGEKASTMTYDDEQALISYLNKAKKREKVVTDCLLLIYKTGCRSSEAAALTWIDYDMRKLHLCGTKTETSDRRIPVCDEVIEMLDARAETPHENSDLIFPTRTGVQIEPKALLRKIKNINGHTVKDLRHTYATRGAEQGINPKILQLLLGHSKIETTLKYYTHISDETKLEAVQKIAVPKQSNPAKIIDIQHAQ